MSKCLLPVLVAVLLTAALCTLVFAGQWVLSHLDARLQDRADERRALDQLDADVLVELGSAGLMCPPGGRHA